MLSSIARRSLITLAKRPLTGGPTTAVRAFSAAYRPTQTKFVAEKVPDEDYVDGHLVNEHLEYLNDMVDKTVEIEKSLDDLKETYAQKRQAYEDAGLLEDKELVSLLDKAAEQKASMAAQLSNLKTVVLNAHTMAIDAPDGMSDSEVRENFQEVNRIIDHAAKHEDTAAVNKRHDMEEKIQKERARDPEHDW